MKKKILTGLLLLGIAGSLGLSGCGSRSDTATETKLGDWKKSGTETETTGTAESGAQKEAAESEASEKTEGKEAAGEEQHGVKLLPLCLKKYEDWLTSDLYVTTRYFGIELPEEEAKKYPVLQQSFDRFRDGEATSKKESGEELLEVAEEILTNEPEMVDYYNGLSETTDGTVFRADTNAVSILVNWFSYWGGAHGMYAFSGLNYDTESGKKLEITDVVTDLPAFWDVVEKKLAVEYPELTIMYPDTFQDKKSQGAESAGEAWLLGYEGVTVCFSPYELGSYADGAQFITVYFDEEPTLFTEKYREVPETYVIPFVYDMPIRVSGDWDGSRELVSVERVYLEDEVAYNRVLHFGDRERRFSTYGYDAKSFIVKKEGNYYFYYNDIGEGYSDVNVIPLSDEINREDEPFGYDIEGYESYETEELESGTRSVETTWPFIDPDHFRVESTFYAYSTMFGRNTAHVTASGRPEADSDTFQVLGNWVFKLKQSVHGREMTGDWQLSEKEALIPEGSYLFVQRIAADESWLDVQLVEEKELEIEPTDYMVYYNLANGVDRDSLTGQRYRLFNSSQDWPYAIDGIEIEDLFDGTLYAG